MEITIKNTNKERQSPTVTINTEGCFYPYAMRDAIKLALTLDGFEDETINEIFGIYPVTCKGKDD